MTRPTIIAGNWKLNPPRREGERLFREVCDGLSTRQNLPASVRVIIIPPFPFLGAFTSQRELRVELGAQDVATESWGAYTGEVGAPLLKEFGVSYALVGHSERRHIFAETDAQVAAKVSAAAAGGLIPILCVGETEAERDASETFEVVERQLQVGLGALPKGSPVLVAYEPVWAIGTGRSATVAQAAEVHRFIRHRLEALGDTAMSTAVPILYGGSTKPDNATELLADKDIDGLLIGGASLDGGSFLGILDAGLLRAAF